MDQNKNGVPDDEAVVDVLTDLDGNGNSDNYQSNIKVIRVPGGAGEMGIKTGQHTSAIQFLSHVDIDEISDTQNRPSELPFGSYNFIIDWALFSRRAGMLKK